MSSSEIRGPPPGETHSGQSQEQSLLTPAAVPLLLVSRLSKAFPPSVRALIEVDFELRAGEVHALLGENGAGKSTLSRIIAGLTAADTGQMLLKGQLYVPASRRSAEHLGVRMVMQELNLIPTLTVAESLFFDRLPNRLGFVDFTRLRNDACALLQRVGLDCLDPDARIESLGIGQQQLVEIAAGLSVRCEVLILDEPTAALADTEIEVLFRQIATLKSTGVGILYISHRMEEIGRIADRITVLRDGRITGTRDATALRSCPPEDREMRASQSKGQDAKPKASRDTFLSEIIHLMVGRDLGQAQIRSRHVTREVAMRVEGLRAGQAVRDVSFELFRGEILGFAGLMGAGRTETLRAIFGADQRDAGRIYLRGASVPSEISSPRDAVAAGIAFLTEDRKSEGLLLPWPVRSNITLTCLAKVRRTAGWILSSLERIEAGKLAERLRIRCVSVEQPVRELSGGNQQKVVIAKWLYRDCDILLFDEPTRGIDVGAKFEIYQLLVELAEQGRAVIVISSELPELFAICNRVAVLSAGVLTKIFEADEFDQGAVMEAAVSNYLKRNS